MKTYELPHWMAPWIDKHLKAIGYGLSKPQKLAKAILNASTDYQESLSTTPWKDPAAQAAYLSYFFPLNYLRTLKVIDEGKRWGFFEGVDSVLDFGCGPGTTSKALLNDDEITVPQFHGTDIFPELGGLYLDSPRTNSEMRFHLQRPAKVDANSLLSASYVLNELKGTPPWFFDFDKLLVIEPSTKQAFPKLIELRSELLAKGFDVVAPCPHSHTCPLSESKRDWCHDRLHWEQPAWFQKIQALLPIKNNTLSFSYLLASRTPLTTEPYARVVGDALVEKGKTRWLICQGPEREFLSFLKRQGKAPLLRRGDRLQLSLFEKRGQELRFELKDLKKI